MVGILAVGLDPILLSTCALVLGHSFPDVLCASPAEAINLLRLQAIPLVVLCHTLMDRHPALCRQIHAIAPSSLILLLQIEESRGSPVCDECTIVPRPEALLQAARHLLEAHGNNAVAAAAQAPRPLAPRPIPSSPYSPNASFR